MSPRDRSLTTLVTVVSLSLLWLVLAPASLGGSLTLVSVQGSSMEPTLETGDLALLHRDSAYAVGEVVAFRSDMAGALVLHRIVADEPATGRFILKGDNNDFLDRYRPLPDEVVGRMVLHIPVGPADLIRASVPWLLGLGAAIVLLLLAEVARPARPARRRLRRSAGHG